MLAFIPSLETKDPSVSFQPLHRLREDGVGEGIINGPGFYLEAVVNGSVQHIDHRFQVIFRSKIALADGCPQHFPGHFASRIDPAFAEGF